MDEPVDDRLSPPDEAVDPVLAALAGPAVESTEPVARALGTDRDLYDTATWEVRTRLDELSVASFRWLRIHRRKLLYAAIVAILLVQSLSLLVALLSTNQSTLRLVALLLVSFLPGVVVTWYLWYRYVTPPKPLKPLCFTFGVAFVFASAARVVSLQFELVSQLPGVGILLYSVFVLAPIYEGSKWAAVRLYTYRGSEFTHVIDGALYGAAAGLGFIFAVNSLSLTFYFSDGAITTASAGGDVWTYASILMIESPGQVLYASVAGYYLGLAKFNATNAGPIMVKGLVLAIGFHAVYFVAISGLRLIGDVIAVLFAVGYFCGVWIFLARKLRRYRAAQRAASAGPLTQPSAAATTPIDQPNQPPRPTVDQPAELPQSPVERLTALQELHRREVLTDREFDEKRREVLDRI